MVKNDHVMVCLLACLTIFCELGAAAKVQKPAHVSFDTAMGSKRKSFFAEHRTYSSSDGEPVYESDGIDPDDLDQDTTQKLAAQLRGSLAASSEHIALLNVEHREEIEGGEEAKDFRHCAQAAAMVFRIHWASLGSHRELYVWVKNYLEKEEEEARAAYLAAMQQLNDALESGGSTDQLCAEQLRLSQILTAATQARENPDDFAKHRVFVALEKMLEKQFGQALKAWLAELAQGNEATDFEQQKYAIGRQLDMIRTAKDQAFYRCHKQKKIHGSI